MPHNFAESLAQSHAADSLPLWEEMYRAAFPTMEAMINHRQNGWHQKAGIDRSVVLACSRQILIDEKVRGKNKKTGKVYDDILLEVWSDEERSEPGWVVKPLQAEYIAYAIAPLGKGYLLPVLQLQQAWARNGEQWTKRRVCRAENFYRGNSWTTVSVPVPAKELFPAIGRCLRLQFKPCEWGES